VAAWPTRNESGRDCRSPLMLPFTPGQRPELAVDCETSQTLFERMFDRLRDQ
jgi:hypothetical protein